MFNTALFWHSQDIATVPLYYRSKKPITKWKQYKTEMPTLKQLAEWYLGPRMNMAIVTTDNLVVLDFDNPIEYGYWFCYQMTNNPDVIDTYMVMTSRGLHLYYWVEEPFDKIKINQPYEIKSHGCLVTIPPSVHKSGIAYRAINSSDKIKKVVSIDKLLTFCCVKFEQPKTIFNNDPWSIYQPPVQPMETVDLLDLFPDARKTDETHYRTDCPVHGNKDNFMLDIETGVGYCFAGCGSFSSSQILEMMN